MTLSVSHQSLVQESKSNFEDWVKTLAVTGGITVADLKLTPIITQFLNEQGLCLGNFLSSAGHHILASVVNPLVTINEKIGSLFGETLTGEVFVPAVCEELEFRGLLQKLMLTELPRKILQKVAPEYADCVDSDIAKINRIALVALFFAYCHLNTLDCSTGGGLNQLLGGVLYGTLYEYSDLSLLTCINLHCLFNLANKLL